MNAGSILVSGVSATIAMTTLMAVSHGIGLTRMSIPFLLGTILTPNRDRALVVGAVFHMLNGCLFAFFYAVLFEALGRRNWWLGATIGFVHAVFVLSVGMPILPGLHPRMVSEYYGPTPNRRLQPPGFFARNYGRQTAAVTIGAHVLYGAIVGGFYEVVDDREVSSPSFHHNNVEVAAVLSQHRYAEIAGIAIEAHIDARVSNAQIRHREPVDRIRQRSPQ
jgi:hypothetical protein